MTGLVTIDDFCTEVPFRITLGSDFLISSVGASSTGEWWTRWMVLVALGLGGLSCALLALVVGRVGRLMGRRARFVAALRPVPGPRALPILGNSLQLTGTPEEFFQIMEKCANTYGPMYRLWVGTRPFIFINSAEAVQPILNSSVHIDKSPDYRFIEPWVGNGLVTSTGAKWHYRRKLLTPSFHSRVLEEFLESLLNEATVLANKLTSHLDGAPFDVLPYAKRAALDVICDTALGKHVGAQSNSSNAYVVAIDRMTSIAQRRFITPWLKPDILFNLTTLGREQKKAIDIIHGFTGKVYEQRKQETGRFWQLEQLNGKHQQQPLSGTNGLVPPVPPAPEKPPKRRLALLDLLLDMKHRGANLSDADIREEVDTFTFAGHDTTAAALSWSLYVLGHHPEAQERIVEEWCAARECVRPGECLTVRDVGRLDYLERCIKESLRLYPVVPLIARDIRSPVNVLGVEVPAGCNVIINTYLLHRDPRFFPQPELFDPDRFLTGCEGLRHPFAYVPFSAGSRNCIGQRFAMMELKILLGSILERFHVRSVDPEHSLRLVAEVVLANKGGIHLALAPRSQHTALSNITQSQ